MQISAHGFSSMVARRFDHNLWTTSRALVKHRETAMKKTLSGPEPVVSMGPRALLPLLPNLASSASAVEARVADWMARHGLCVLRVGLGGVFAWFGALKLVPGLSPAEELVTATLSFADPRIIVPALGAWEVAIGLGLMFGVFMRLTLACFFAHMMGTLLPLIFLRGATWIRFPFALTLEGQYIVKNVVLIGAALVIGGARPWRREVKER